MSLNRTILVIGMNSSGSPVAQGDVLMQDVGTNNAWKNPGSAAQVDLLTAVVYEPYGIAMGAQGLLVTAGYVPKINLTATASPGDRIRTSATAFRADRNSANGAGDFGVALSSGSTPPAMLFGTMPFRA